MRAVRTDSLDSVADYRLIDLPKPQPGANEVRIKVAACGVGYVDALIALGRYQVKPSLPHIPGSEVAGVVDAVGGDVVGLTVGDRVMAQVSAGFAQFAIARPGSVVRVPPRMTFEEACGFRVNYVTALHGLRDRAALQPGERLLVSGAAGGVGLAAVQIGKALGATVIACASTEEKRAFAMAAGADQSIDTNPEGWRDRLKALTDGAGADVYFDPVCGPLFELAFRSLAWGGRHLVVGFVGGPIPALPANLPLMKGAALVGVDVRQFGLHEAAKSRATLDDLLAWIHERRLTPIVGRQFSFDDFAQALEFALSGQGLGKTVLTVE